MPSHPNTSLTPLDRGEFSPTKGREAVLRLLPFDSAQGKLAAPKLRGGTRNDSELYLILPRIVLRDACFYYLNKRIKI